MKKIKTLFCIISFLTLSSYSKAQIIVKDVDTSKWSQEINEDWLYELNGNVLFAVSGKNKGLWISDGTEGGSHLIKYGIYPQNEDSEPVVDGNIMYFLAKDSLHGQELWKTDGTEEGTQMLFDLNQGTKTGVYTFKIIGGMIYFVGTTGYSHALWKYDIANGIVSNSNSNDKAIVYPNPTTGELSIDLKQTYEKLHIEITDLSGKVVSKETLYNTSFIKPIINGNAGVYVVDISMPNGKRQTVKIVKQ